MTAAWSSRARRRKSAPTRWCTTSTSGAVSRMSEPLLAVRNLNAYYGPAHILQGVSFEMGVEPVALIGRNGMGKSTLCNAIMGRVPEVMGSVRMYGEALV